MGLFNSIKDHFDKGEFGVSRNKKLKSVSADFKKAFDLTLVFYKGNMIAEGDLTLAALDKKTAKTATSESTSVKVKASMKVGDVEKLFDDSFGVKVQIKDITGKHLVPNEITLGQAKREEYK